jgi:hypothetical protein
MEKLKIIIYILLLCFFSAIETATTQKPAANKPSAQKPSTGTPKPASNQQAPQRLSTGTTKSVTNQQASQKPVTANTPTTKPNTFIKQKSQNIGDLKVDPKITTKNVNVPLLTTGRYANTTKTISNQAVKNGGKTPTMAEGTAVLEGSFNTQTMNVGQILHNGAVGIAKGSTALNGKSNNNKGIQNIHQTIGNGGTGVAIATAKVGGRTNSQKLNIDIDNVGNEKSSSQAYVTATVEKGAKLNANIDQNGGRNKVNSATLLERVKGNTQVVNTFDQNSAGRNDNNTKTKIVLFNDANLVQNIGNNIQPHDVKTQQVFRAGSTNNVVVNQFKGRRDTIQSMGNGNFVINVDASDKNANKDRREMMNQVAALQQNNGNVKVDLSKYKGDTIQVKVGRELKDFVVF